MKFRRATSPKEQSPEGAKPKRANNPLGSREDAEALLALLQPGGSVEGKAQVSSERMREAAKRLIAEIESARQSGTTKPETSPDAGLTSEPKQQDASRRPRRSLFSKPAPLAPMPPKVAPPAQKPVKAHPPEPVPPQVIGAISPMGRTSLLSRKDVQKLVSSSISGAALHAEHPTIIALSLQPKPPSEQAKVLRALGRGQARAVHRSLRLLDLSG